MHVAQTYFLNEGRINNMLGVVITKCSQHIVRHTWMIVYNYANIHFYMKQVYTLFYEGTQPLNMQLHTLGINA